MSVCLIRGLEQAPEQMVPPFLCRSLKTPTVHIRRGHERLLEEAFLNNKKGRLLDDSRGLGLATLVPFIVNLDY